MKKNIKVFLIVIITILVIIIIDTIQALALDNSPILKLRTYYEDTTITYIDKGLLVDTYKCINNKQDTVIKGFSYSCTSIDDFVIVDTTRKIGGFTCAEALEEIYEDDLYKYYLSCMKSSYIEVRYNNGKKETIIEALELNHITIQDLDKFNIKYYKQNKN